MVFLVTFAAVVLIGGIAILAKNRGPRSQPSSASTRDDPREQPDAQVAPAK